jgi:hypothetical protein
MSRNADIDRNRLLDAFDRLGAVAVDNDVVLDILMYGGSALMIASNFRFATGDVDIAPIGDEKPEWFDRAVQKIASDMGFEEGENWLNDAVDFYLSRLARKDVDHWEYGTFPRGGEAVGLRVFVPNPDYMLALKLKAMRVNDPYKGDQERSDIQNLIHVNGVKTVDEAIGILERYFPISAKNADKQRFLLKNLFSFERTAGDAPVYPARSL